MPARKTKFLLANFFMQCSMSDDTKTTARATADRHFRPPLLPFTTVHAGFTANKKADER
jgi:hypothetical protein